MSKSRTVGKQGCGFLGATLLSALLAATAWADERWIEVRSPRFVVISNASASQATRVAEEFEAMRGVIQQMLPGLEASKGSLQVLALRDERDMRTFLPEYAQKKGEPLPAGVFRHSTLRADVVLRLDVEVEPRFAVVYHEYFHSIARQRLPGLPLWLSEGLAEFWAQTVIQKGKVEVGQPDPVYLQVLRQRKLLPLDSLVNVDATSPHYNEGNKKTLFYAESWALVHYFAFGEGRVLAPNVVSRACDGSARLWAVRGPGELGPGGREGWMLARDRA